MNKNYYLVELDLISDCIVSTKDLFTTDLEESLKNADEFLKEINYFKGGTKNGFYVYSRNHVYALSDEWKLAAVPMTEKVWELY